MSRNWWAIGTYLPECIVSNHDIHEEIPEFSEDYSRSKLGIETRHIAKDESCVEMALSAVDDLKKQGVLIDDTDLLILVTQTPDYPLPSMSCILQDRLSLGSDTICFDVNMGCSGYVYALSIAYSYLRSSLADNALVVTCERYSKYIKKDDYSNRGIFGDGATATYLTKDMIEHVRDFSFFTDGSGYENIIVPDLDTGFKMDGPKVMSFAIKRIPKMIKEILIKAGVDKDEIDYYVFHQGNEYMLKTIQHRLGIEDDKMVFSLMRSGNTVSSSIPLAIADLMMNDKLSEGRVLLLCGFGVGLSAAGVIITC